MPKAAAHGVHTHAGWGLPLRRLPAMDLPFLVLVVRISFPSITTAWAALR